MSIQKLVLFIWILFSNFCWSATPAQVEKYLFVSQTEEELLSLEKNFSFMQNHLKNENNSTYDMQLLSLRFKEYITKNISDDEMVEILDNYKNVVLMQFINASIEAKKHDLNKTKHYVKTLKANPEAAIRITLIHKISTFLYPKEAILVLFDNLMTPLMKQGIGKEQVNDTILKEMRKNYVTMMLEAAKDETLFAARDFSMQELETLLKIAKTSAVAHESKVVFTAMAYALKDFFTSIAQRYDIQKHQTHTTK